MVDDMIKTGVTFDEALRRLKAGRTYTNQKTGIVMLSNRGKDGVEYFYALNVPANYSPARRYQVRIQLHGGVGVGLQRNLASAAHALIGGDHDVGFAVGDAAGERVR